MGLCASTASAKPAGDGAERPLGRGERSVPAVDSRNLRVKLVLLGALLLQHPGRLFTAAPPTSRSSASQLSVCLHTHFLLRIGGPTRWCRR